MMNDNPSSTDHDDQRRTDDREGRDAGPDEGSRRREGCGRGHRDGFRRKGRVLHTRISEELSEDIRRLARDLRVPTSNLVRNVLEEVFSVVESVSEDVGQLFEEVVDEAEGARDRIHERVLERRRRRSRRRGFRLDEEDLEQELREDEHTESTPGGTKSSTSDFDDVLGWQPLVLHRAQRCARCGRELARGEQASLGLTEAGSSRLTICQACTPTG